MRAQWYLPAFIIYLLLAGCQSEPDLPPAPEYKVASRELIDSFSMQLSGFPFSLHFLRQAEMNGNGLWLLGIGKTPYGEWDDIIYRPSFSGKDSANVLFSRMMPRYRRGFSRLRVVDQGIVIFGNAAVLHLDTNLAVQQQILLDRPDSLSLTGNGLSQILLNDGGDHFKYVIGIKNMYGGVTQNRFSKTPAAYAMYHANGILETYFDRYPALFYEPGHIISNELSAVTYHDQRIFVTHLGEEMIHEYDKNGKEIRSYSLPVSKVFDPTLQYVSADQLPGENPLEVPSVRDTIKKYSTHFITGFTVDQNIIHLLLVDRRFVDGKQLHKTIYRRWDMANEEYVEDVLPIPAHAYGLLANANEDTVQVAYQDRVRKVIKVDKYLIR